MARWRPVLAFPTSSSHPVVTLADLPALTAGLAQRIRAAGFRPDVVVGIEEGARLPAEALGRELGVPVWPVVVCRRGHGLKKSLAPLIGLLPRAVTNTLRHWEERSGFHARPGRTVTWPRERDLRGKNILLLDDAADTGGTLRAVKDDLAGRGVEAGRVRAAVLAATTPAGQAEADYYVLRQNCVLPWSPDNPERPAALARMAAVRFPDA